MKSKIFLSITVTIYFLLGNYCSPAYSQTKKDEQLKVAEDYISKGYNLFQSGSYSESIEEYDKALRIKLRIFGEVDTNVADLYNGIGLAYYYQGIYKKAIEINEKALNIRLKILGEGHNDVATSYYNLGLAYYGLGEYTNSIDYFSKALTIAFAINGFKGTLVATIYNNLGLANYNLGENQKAIEYFKKTLDIYLKILSEDDSNLKDIYSNLGMAFYNSGKYQESIKYLKKSINIRLKEDGNKNLFVASYYDYIGLAYIYFGDYQKGIEYLNESLAIYLKLQSEKSVSVAIVYVNFGMAYDGLADYEKSIDYYEKALSIFLKESAEEQSYLASVYNNLGQAYYHLGIYQRAIEFYEKGIYIQLKTSDEQDPLVSKIYNNLGEVYSAIGKLNQAIEYFEKALSVQIKISVEEHPDIAIYYQNLGNTYNDLGNYEKAKDYLEKAIKIQLKSNGENKTISTSYMNLGLVYYHLGMNEMADTIFHRALTILINAVGEDNPDVALLYNNMAYNYFIFEKYNEAIECLEKGIKIQSKTFDDDNRTTSFLYSNLGAAYNFIGDYQKSIAYFEKALSINLRLFGEQYPSLAVNYSDLCFSYLMNNDQATFEKLLRSYAYSVSGNINRQLSYLSEEDLTKYLESTDGYELISTLFFSYRYNSPAPTDAVLSVSTSTKGVLWNQVHKLKTEVYSSGDSSITNSYFNLLSLKQQINKVYEMTNQDRKQQNINLDSLIYDEDKMESSLYRKLGIKVESSSIQWQDIQSTLKQDEAFVDILRVQGLYLDSSGIQVLKLDTIQYAALIVTKETPQYPEMVVLPKGAEMEGLWFQNYQSHTSGSNKLQSDNSSYPAYWQPIADKLQGKKHIYFCPDGIYNKINLNVLFNPTDSSYLSDEKDIQLVTNIKEVMKLKQDTDGQKFISKNMNAVVIGNPKFNLSANDTLLFASNTRSLYDEDVSVSAIDTLTRGLNISQLPGTEKEVNFISSTLKNYGWNVSTYTGNSATEEVIKSLRSPNILHIATHGYFLEDNSSNKNLNGLQLLGQTNSGYHDNPLLRSGLLFAGAQNTFNGNESDNRDNGVLTSQEAMSLFLERTDLVVLSACETAGGDVKNGEGVYGLQRAFRVAGAHSILMSMWKVDDEATKELMTAFYKNWIENGMNKHGAFKAAQLQLRKIPKYNHPYYWGAFVMVGE